MNAASTAQAPPADPRVVLCHGKREFTVEDVSGMGWFLGRLQPVWSQLMEAVSCEQRANELELEADDEVLTSMSEEFRYERDLLTVEETERWLADRGMTEEQFSDYLIRRYWRENPPDSEEAEETDYLEGSPELRKLLRVELMLSGEFDRMARALSWRIAASSKEDASEKKPELLEVERARFFERTGLDESSLPEALKQLGRTSEWLNECLQMEVNYRQICVGLLTDEARRRTLTVMRLPLTRVEIEKMVVRSRHAAQEAVLCLKEKLLSSDELAKECGSTWEKDEFFLDDCAADVQQELLCVASGDVLEPKETDTCFLVYRIAAKIEPDLEDAEVRARIDGRLREAHFSELASKTVRWRWRIQL